MAAEQTKNFLSTFCAAPPSPPRRKTEKEREKIFGFAARAKRALRGAFSRSAQKRFEQSV